MPYLTETEHARLQDALVHAEGTITDLVDEREEKNATIAALRVEVERKDKALRWYAADYDHAKGCSQWDGGAKARAALSDGAAP